MPESSIADEITRLSGCRNDILSAISSKGVTVPAGSVLSSCPALIGSIQTGGGGGGGSNTLVNSTASAFVTASVDLNHTFTQRNDFVDVDYITSTSTAKQSGSAGSIIVSYKKAQWGVFDWSAISGYQYVGITNRGRNTSSYYTVSREKPSSHPWVSATLSPGDEYSGSGRTFRYASASGTSTNTLGRTISISSMSSRLGSGNYPLEATSQIYIYYVGTGGGTSIMSYNVAASAVALTVNGSSVPYPDKPVTEEHHASFSATGVIYPNTGYQFNLTLNPVTPTPTGWSAGIYSANLTTITNPFILGTGGYPKSAISAFTNSSKFTADPQLSSSASNFYANSGYFYPITSRCYSSALASSNSAIVSANFI